MIVFRWRGLVVGELWYDEDEISHPIDVLRRRGLQAPVAGRGCTDFMTIQNDLNQPAEVRLRHMRKNTRYEIRRADERDDLVVEYWDQPECDVLAKLVSAHRDMAQRKRLRRLDFSPAYAYLSAGRLRVTRATDGSGIDVWHSYLVGSTWARLLHSISSLKKDGDPEHRARAGRANRLLHWKDMEYLQRAGLRVYDWGGYYPGQTDADLLRINHFKASFGGQVTLTYDCTCGLTQLGRGYIGLRRVLRPARSFPVFRILRSSATSR